MKTHKSKLHFCKNSRSGMLISVIKSHKSSTNLTSNRITSKNIFLNTMEKPVEYPHLRINRDEEEVFIDLKIKKNKVKDESQERKDYILHLQTKGWVSIISAQLKKKRIEKRISQADLAFMLKWDQNYVSRIEAGKINISLENLTKIAGALGCYVKIEDKQYVL
jgi:ribosome-binding protein aMBF1 (putative translation factor)